MVQRTKSLPHASKKLIAAFWTQLFSTDEEDSFVTFDTFEKIGSC